MNLREVILGLLIEQPMHAYALKRVLGPRLSPTELINDGVLYPLLTKMAAQGLISGATRLPRDGNRTARISDLATHVARRIRRADLRLLHGPPFSRQNAILQALDEETAPGQAADPG
jgi:DNA-binding PadR family transcriptional regulator